MTHVGAKQHLWVYMGHDSKGSYEYCGRCKTFRYNGKKISETEYNKRFKSGKIKGKI